MNADDERAERMREMGRRGGKANIAKHGAARMKNIGAAGGSAHTVSPTAGEAMAHAHRIDEEDDEC